jgi:hypothetical protein
MSEKDNPLEQKPANTAPKDIYQAASRAVGKEEEWPEYAERKHLNKRSILIIVIVLAVIVITGGAYALLKGHKSKPAATKTATTSSQPNQPAPAASNGASANTTSYTASGSDLNLSFNYPNNWTVTPTSGTDTSNQTITASSPSTTIENADNQSVTGKVVVTIRPGTATISELNSGTPTAAQASSQIAYTAPTTNQHQYPYLTFIHFTSGSSAAGAFEEVMVTGINTFTKGQAVTAGDLSSLDPIIAATFYTCGNTACSGNGSGYLSITGSTWTNDSLFVATQNLFSSLKLN